MLFRSQPSQSHISQPSLTKTIKEAIEKADKAQVKGRSYTGYNISTYKILNKRQIVYTKSPQKLKPFGIIKENKNKPGIVSVLYAIYDVKEGFDPNYISVYFEPYFRLNKYLLPLINKGAKNTINISDETALSGEVHFPLSYTEQQKIAYLISNITSFNHSFILSS